METIFAAIVFICILWDAFLTSYIFLRVVDQSKRITTIERSDRPAAGYSGSHDRIDVHLHVCQIAENGEKEK